MKHQPTTTFCRRRVRLTVVVVAVACGHVAGCGLSNETVLTLNGSGADLRYVTPTGPGGRQFVTRGPRGWTISVPNCASTEAIGLTSKAVINGDFLLEAAYEIDASSQATSSVGTGPSLYLATDRGAKNAAHLARLNREKEGSVMSAAFLYSDKNGRRKRNAEFAPSQANSGRLRLERKGSLVIFSSKDADNDWTPLRQVEFGELPITTLRIAMERGGSPAPATIHWTEIVLQLNQTPLAWQSTWLRRGLFLTGTLVLPLALVATWLMLDRIRFGKMKQRPAVSG